MARVSMVLAVSATAVCVAIGVGVEPLETTAVTPVEPVETSAAKTLTGPPAVELLRAWDARRAEAWSRGDQRSLAALYTPGSEAGRRDLAMLRAWLARGLTVRGFGTQLLAVRELVRTPTTWTLRVTDRLVGGTAVGAETPVALPLDSPTTRSIVFRLVDGRWRVAAVRPQPVRRARPP